MLDGNNCFMSPAGAWFERISTDYANRQVLVRHIAEGWDWIVDLDTFVSQWRCG